MRNIHPGEVLLEKFLKPKNINIVQLSKDLKVSEGRMAKIVRGKRIITADASLRLSKYFNTTAKYWLGLQNDYDINEANHNFKNEYKSIKRYKKRSA